MNVTSLIMDPIFQKLAQAEEQFFKTDFFAPVFSHSVRVNIQGVLVDFKVNPHDYRGWGIFQRAGKNTAQFVRDASRTEISTYLDVFPRTSFIVISNDEIGLGISASNDRFFTMDATPFFLADNIQKFETVYLRHDGANFVFERRVNRSTRNAARLREALSNKVSPKKLDAIGLSKFERNAYSFVLELERQKELQSTEGRVRSAVQRGGGKYKSYRRVSGNLAVTYEIYDEEHDRWEVYTSTVSENLSVVSAGICLNGTDRQHDLQSLMHIIKEGQDSGRIYRW